MAATTAAAAADLFVIVPIQSGASLGIGCVSSSSLGSEIFTCKFVMCVSLEDAEEREAEAEEPHVGMQSDGGRGRGCRISPPN